MKSQLCLREFTDLDELTNCYNSTLSSLLDKFVRCRKHVPWFNGEIKEVVQC